MSPLWKGVIWRSPLSTSMLGGSSRKPRRRQPRMPSAPIGPDGAVIAMTWAPDGSWGRSAHRSREVMPAGSSVTSVVEPWVDTGRTATQADQPVASLDGGVRGTAPAPTPQVPEYAARTWITVARVVRSGTTEGGATGDAAAVGELAAGA